MANKKILFLGFFLNISITQAALNEDNPLIDSPKTPFMDNWHDMAIECALSCALPAFTVFCLWQTIGKTYYTSS